MGWWVGELGGCVMNPTDLPISELSRLSLSLLSLSLLSLSLLFRCRYLDFPLPQLYFCCRGVSATRCHLLEAAPARTI